ncbi:hypothetical protein HK102_001663 [Quaeritorhiza haematococci]|nr:hypothetical protein HK102_001663 [Quaeritorhiza haematococci]
MDVPISKLAADTSASRDRKNRSRCNVPFVLWVMFGLVAVILATAIPTTNILSQDLLATTAREASKEIINAIAQAGVVITGLANNPVVTRHLVTRYDNLSSNPDVNGIVLSSTMKGFEFRPSISCFARENISGLVPGNTDWYNITLMGWIPPVDVATGPATLFWLDYRTGPALMATRPTFNGSDWVLPPSDREFPIVRLASERKNQTEQNKGLAHIRSKTRDMKCYYAYFPQLGTREIDCYGQLRRAIVLFQDDFTVIATSLGSADTNDFLSRDLSTVGFNNTNVTFDSVVVELRTTLMQRYSSTVKISETPQTAEAMFQGVNYVYTLMSFNVTTTDRYTIAVLAPRDQIYGDIDKANRDAIIVVVVVTIAVAALIGLLMWWIVRPLGTLSQAMERLTSFDFAALENGTLLEVRSYVAEIFNIQDTFGTMVKAL